MFDRQGWIDELDRLAVARTPLLGARPDKLCSPCEVLLRLGAAVKRQELGGVEAWAATSALVSGLDGVHGMRLHGREDRAELVVSFWDTDDGLLGREKLLDMDDLVLRLGDRTITITPAPLRARLPPGSVTLNLYKPPIYYARVGFGKALLRAAGYGDTARVVHEFLGDPPGGPASRRSGSLPNTEVLVLIVVPPPTDPTLAALPDRLHMGMGGFVPIRVEGRERLPRGAFPGATRAAGERDVRPACVDFATQTEGGERAPPVHVATQCGGRERVRERAADVPSGQGGGVGVVSLHPAPLGGRGAVREPVPRACAGPMRGGVSVTMPVVDVDRAVGRVRELQREVQSRHPVCVAIDERRVGGGAPMVAVPRVSRVSETGVCAARGVEGWVWEGADEITREACMSFLEEEVPNLSWAEREGVCVEARVHAPRMWEGGAVGVGRPHPLLCDWLLQHARELGGEVMHSIPDRMEVGGEGVTSDGARVGGKRRQEGGDREEEGAAPRRSSRLCRPPVQYWAASPSSAVEGRAGGQ